MRLRGHALCAEGKPCKRTCRRRQPPYTYDIVHDSTGRALCECGEQSPVLGSDGARKRWHHAHKEQIRGGFEADSGNIITEEEKQAIDALHRLAKRWPQTLKLVSMGGSLHVIHANDERFHDSHASVRGEAVLDSILGIPNDGGDW